MTSLIHMHLFLGRLIWLYTIMVEYSDRLRILQKDTAIALSPPFACNDGRMSFGTCSNGDAAVIIVIYTLTFIYSYAICKTLSSQTGLA